MMPPMKFEMLLVAYCHGFPREEIMRRFSNTGVRTEFLADLVQSDLIAEDFRVTARGRAYVVAALNTPMPEPAWMVGGKLISVDEMES